VTAPAPLALLCAVPLECEALASALAERREVRVGRKPGWAGRLEEVAVLLLPCGMGKTNAAHALTALLEGGPVRGVLGFGIGGAYPGSGAAVGDLALATAAVYGDEGVHAPSGWLSTKGIGIPLWEEGTSRAFNVFPVDAAWRARARGALEAAGLAVREGPFVTVSACSGTAALGRAMESRFPGALCEGMEGAALAHVAAIYGVPYLELRGVSNRVEDRDLSRWRIAAAAEAAQRGVRAVVRGEGGG
jgi:futalosine hydrolase